MTEPTVAAWNAKRNVQREREKRIDEMVAKYRPKVIEQRIENGVTVSVLSAGYAEGSVARMYCK